MLRVNSVQELMRADCDEHHMISVLNSSIDGGIVQPPRIEWFMDVTVPTLQQRFVGNHRRKLKKTYEQLATLGITFTYEKHLTEESFLQFLAVYRDVIGHKEHPRFRLTEESYAELSDVPLSGVWAHRAGVFLGGTIVRDYGNYYALSYSAYPQFDRKELEVGLGVPLFDQVYQRSAAEGRKRISYGMDTNMYGFHLSMGLLEYKLSIGCTPAPKDLHGVDSQTVFVMRADASTLAWYEGQGDIALHIATEMSGEELRQHFSHIQLAQHTQSLSALVHTHREILKTHIQ
ncbi:MAG: GNAT family N-acetyltransferase [Candidatus Kerfeldbacteria bacterium]|nr:GNAT family N-acetyltransferase [Candidatus Kerfeldbacteria bacterium]